MKNLITKDIGLRIRQLRQKNGLTIEEAAHLAGVHPNYLGDAERGKKNFSITTLDKLAKVLCVPISEIFSGKAGTHTEKSSPVDPRLAALFKRASPDERDFIIRTASFITRNRSRAKQG